MSYMRPLERISSILSYISVCQHGHCCNTRGRGKGRNGGRGGRGGGSRDHWHWWTYTSLYQTHLHTSRYMYMYMYVARRTVYSVLYCGGMSETSKRTGSCGLHASSLIHRPEWEEEVYNVVSVMHTCTYNRIESCRLMPSIHTCTYWHIYTFVAACTLKTMFMLSSTKFWSLKSV